MATPLEETTDQQNKLPKKDEPVNPPSVQRNERSPGTSQLVGMTELPVQAMSGAKSGAGVSAM
jgi:hypothetical protein